MSLTHRPQEPEPPFPYDAQEVSFLNEKDEARLAGTLTLPKSDGPFPAVILITGSGPQDRNDSVFGHKLFLVLDDHLNSLGIAVLRMDDRGVGESTGNFSEATSEDFG
jgi:predicted acyl esterase